MPSDGPPEAYVEALRAAGTEPRLDDRTARDLDLDRVFSVLDRTVSAVGRQVLYHRLRNPTDSAEPIGAFARLVAALDRDPAAAARARRVLAPLKTRVADTLPALLLGPLPPKRFLYLLLPVLAVAPVLSVGFAFIWPRALLVMIAALVAGQVTRAFLVPRLRYLAQPFRLVRQLLGAAEALARLPLPHGFEGLAADLHWLAPLKRRSWLFLWDDASNELVRLLYDELNTLLLLDLNAFVGTLDELRRGRDALHRVYRFVGEVDVALAVLAYRKEREDWVAPEFRAPGAGMVVEDAVHPLLDTPVPNGMTLDAGRGTLITGSNMSGKTTFVRTIGLNALMAQTIGTCLAKRYAAPCLRVASSIVRFDDLAEGTSYYLAEVKAVLDLVRDAGGETPCLFLLDEVFRGTNAIERISAARAVLHHLARAPHFVIAATHDLELVGLLGDRYEPSHFREEVVPEGMTFDYMLRPGVSSTRNAIALLEVLGAPPPVVAEALDTARELERTRGA